MCSLGFSKGNFPLRFPRKSPRPPCFGWPLAALTCSGICVQVSVAHLTQRVKYASLFVANVLKVSLQSPHLKSLSTSRKPMKVYLYRASLCKSIYMRKSFASLCATIALAPSRNLESVLLAKRLLQSPCLRFVLCLYKKTLTSKARWAVVGYCVRIMDGYAHCGIGIRSESAMVQFLMQSYTHCTALQKTL